MSAGRMRALLAAWFNPFVWRSPAASSRKLMSFARAEQGSMLDLMLASNLCTNEKRAALYLRHALDESRHARLFHERALVLDETAPNRVHADTERLYQQLGEVGFVAFVHLGEARGRAQFESYHRYFEARGDQAQAQLFDRIAADERQHERYTGKLLQDLCESPRAAKRALRRVVRWELWRAWLRMGRALSSRVYAVLMFLLYLSTAPLALALRLAPRMVGWRAGSPGR